MNTPHARGWEAKLGSRGARTRTLGCAAWVLLVLLAAGFGLPRGATADEQRSTAGQGVIIVLVDTSPSMSGPLDKAAPELSKMAAVKDSLRKLVMEMPDSMRFIGVSFNTDVHRGPNTVLDAAGRTTIDGWIAGLASQLDQGTFAWLSLGKVLDEARATLVGAGRNDARLLMYTDGEDVHEEWHRKDPSRWPAPVLLPDVLRRNGDILAGLLPSTIISIGFEFKGAPGSQLERDGQTLKENERLLPVHPATRPEELLPLIPMFAWSPETPIRGKPVQFADKTRGPAVGYLWEFFGSPAGGSAPVLPSSTEKSPQVVFPSAGEFRIRLTVRGGGRSRSEERTLTVEGPARLRATISEPPREIEVGQQVQFASSFEGHVEQFSWDFGDGTTSSEQNPKHVFSQAGDYDVSLTVRGPDADPFTARAPYMVRVRPLPGATARLECPASVTLGEALTVIDASTGGALADRRWDFGDGTPSKSGQVETHLYRRVGTYTLTLVVVGRDGKPSTATREVVVVAPEAPQPRIEGPRSLRVKEVGVFTDETSGGKAVRAEWDMGDGSPMQAGGRVNHAFAQPGQKVVQLTVYSADGSRHYVTHRVDVHAVRIEPSVKGPAGGVAGESLNFSDASTGDTVVRRQWSVRGVAPGSPFPSGADAVYECAFPEAGEYVLDMRVWGLDELERSASWKVVIQPFKATLQEPQAPVVVGKQVALIDTTPGTVTAARWEFGDGQVFDRTYSKVDPAERVVRVTFKKPGVVAYSLRTTGPAGVAAVARGGLNVLPLGKQPVAAFTVEPIQPGHEVEVVFMNTSTGSAQEFEWDFGKGEPTSRQTGIGPVKSKFTPGRYSVKLTAVGGPDFSNSVFESDITVLAPGVPAWVFVLIAVAALVLVCVAVQRQRASSRHAALRRVYGAVCLEGDGKTIDIDIVGRPDKEGWYHLDVPGSVSQNPETSCLPLKLQMRVAYPEAAEYPRDLEVRIVGNQLDGVAAKFQEGGSAEFSGLLLRHRLA